MSKFDTEVRLSREMSLLDATMIGVGAMIGAGIFVLIGIAAGVAGPALILAFILNALVAVLTAMSYAELGSCYHDAGGGYLWVKEGLPKWNGFISGWMSWFAHAVACSLYALGFGAYFELVFHEFGIDMVHWGIFAPQKLLAASVAVIFAYINYRGASETGKIGNLVTITKIVILATFVAFGLELILRTGSWQTAFTPFMPNGIGGVFKAMGLTFIAFQGFEVIAQSSEEIKNPRKNIPRAVMLSLLIVVPIYLLVAVTALGSVTPGNMTPWDYLASHKETALVEVARSLFSGGGVLILIGGIISTMSALNATIYSSSRVAFAMGRDRNFPTILSKVSKKNFTPHWAILISLVIVVLMAVSLPIEDVASAADIMFLLLFLQVNLAMIRLRKLRPDLDRGFVTPLFPWLSILAILMLLFLAIYMLNYSPVAWIVTAIWIALGLTVYKGYASHREVEHVRKVRQLGRIEHKQYRVLICLSNPKSLSALTAVGMAIAKKHAADVLFLHVIEVQEGKSLEVGLTETSRVRPMLEEAISIAAADGVPARSLIEVSHRISQGIVDTALEEDCNFIVIARQRHPAFLERVFSSLLDTVFQKSAAEVAVVHGEFNRERIHTILVPFGDDIHARLAFEIAPALAEYCSAQLRVVAIVHPDLPQSEREERLHKMRELFGGQGSKADLRVIEDKNIANGIIAQAENVDLLLMAGRTGDFLELMFKKSLSREIKDRVGCPVVWVREFEERESVWLSLFRSDKKEGGHNA
ncbi:MAG: amino acid permease [Candidatus Zixiibacteriota bacterium]|nr:MAG: amino acid permease [candidate division Zixibacteria bacterium]